ncbi:hypothetical protein GQ42DRAFT_117895 [Ramicandelaber brevisporus]|nr:hypothetical protein GQ42DRAFT_117895 [Ramicandelaber brevisporus]
MIRSCALLRQAAAPPHRRHLLLQCRPRVVTLSATITRQHSGHSHPHDDESGKGHGHGHQHTEQLERALLHADFRDPGTRITLVGLVANVFLTSVKGVAGVLTNSAALIADAGHSLSDLVSDFVTLYTFRKARQPADALHPFGYGRYEAIGTIGVAAFLITAGGGIIAGSFESIVSVAADPGTSELARSLTEVSAEVAKDAHTHAHALQLDPNAAWFALASIIIKEALYHSTIRVARKTNSDVLVANAWHHRSDALSSVIAFVAIIGADMGIPMLDPIGAIAVAVTIARSGWQLGRGAFYELTDRTAGPLVTNAVEDVLRDVQKLKPEEMIGFSRVRARKTGPYVTIDLALTVPPTLTVQRAHDLEDVARNEIRSKVEGVEEVMIHIHAANQENCGAVPPNANNY